MSLGALAFLNPWLLAALASLPLIYWLLRAVPPKPQQIEFPPTRILIELENTEKTPAKTPWWLLLLRLLAAALVIFALAEPVLNPNRDGKLAGTGPVVIAVDNGWTTGSHWTERAKLAGRLIGEAEAQNRPVVVMATAASAKTPSARIEAPADAKSTIAAISPQPFKPDRKAALAALQSSLASQGGAPTSVVWLADGVDHDQAAGDFAAGLQALANGGTFAVVESPAGGEAIGVVASVSASGKLEAKVVRSGGPARDGIVQALSARSQRLGEAPFKLADGARDTTVTFELPLELRNQVTRVEVAGERSAGSISLLDQRSQWQRVGLLSGEPAEKSQPLLAPLYYIEKAIQPFAEVIKPKDQNLTEGIESILAEHASVLMLADIGTMTGDIKDKVAEWVTKGGVLVRFAGPRLEQGGDGLLPVALRFGGRTLGGALSWSVPQPLQPFEASSPFAGLVISDDVRVSRQVLADPTLLSDETEVWARLADGTPLVTAQKRKAGWVVLFHVTGNSDWSNLPLSGLFVEMLQRVVALTGLADVATRGEAAASPLAAVEEATLLPPVEALDGYGRIGPPPPAARPIAVADLKSVRPDATHPPGLYGPPGKVAALNVVDASSNLAAIGALPAGSIRTGYRASEARQLKSFGLAAALTLLLGDVLAMLALQAGWFNRARSVAAGVLLAVAVSGLVITPDRVAAQASGNQAAAVRPTQPVDDSFALAAALRSRLAYVLTGDAATDETSRLGLNGLGQMLIARTAFEPAEPLGVDIERDELAFFPVLYWPVQADAREPSEAALARIDAYMKGGGLIVFDTRDLNENLPSLDATGGPGAVALQRLIGRLDIPALEPVPSDHVLTKSFYLLRSFPGRFDGGALWVEAEEGSQASDARRPRHSDGVSSILVSSNDFAGAWAIDEGGNAVFPVIPGGEEQREWAYRVGINIVMYALTGNYKADQVHIPALLERLGQ